MLAGADGGAGATALPASYILYDAGTDTRAGLARAQYPAIPAVGVV